jgi:hypothetical protein
MAVDVKKYLRKTGPLYHALSVLYVYLNRHSQLCDVPIEICTNPMGFSFASNGWNYLIEQLKQFDHGHEPEVADSILYKFHQCYQPADMSDVPVSAGFHVAFKPALSIYPWGSFDIEQSMRGGAAKDALTSRFYGPSSLALVQKDLSNLGNLYKSIRTHGYRPGYFRNAFIGGVFLEKADGQRKFVVLQGNHRTAILAHLGYESTRTRYLRGYYKCINEKDIADWFYVKSKVCSEQDAKAYFDSFFVLNGRERAKKMGFDS